MTETPDYIAETETLTIKGSPLPPPSSTYTGEKLPSLSAFMPAYNEEANIRWVVEDTLTKLSMVTDDLELIIVNDGSADRTGEIIDALAREYPQVIAKHHIKNGGYGAALKTGFSSCSKDFIFYTDGDGQFDTAEISTLIPLLKKGDAGRSSARPPRPRWVATVLDGLGSGESGR